MQLLSAALTATQHIGEHIRKASFLGLLHRYELALWPLEQYPGELWDNAAALFERALSPTGMTAMEGLPLLKWKMGIPWRKKLILQGAVTERNDEGLWLKLLDGPEIKAWLPFTSMSEARQAPRAMVPLSSLYQGCSLLAASLERSDRQKH